jgi:hypothetical protein
MIKVFDRDKAGAIAYLDEKKIESITFEKESFFEPNVEVVYWNKLEDKFFLFLKKEAVVVKMDSGSKFYFILEKGKEKEKEFTENILVSKKIETDCNIFLGKNEVLKNGMLILKEYDCNIFNETDVIEITTDNLNKFSNYFTKNIAEAILSLQTMKPEERTVKKLEWLSCFLRKDKGIEEQKVNEIVSILKFSI